MRRSTAAFSTAPVLAGIVAISFLLAGCTTTSSTSEPQEPTETPSQKTGSEFSQGETPSSLPSDPASSVPAADMGQLGTAYFDFNKAEIRGDMRDVLRKNATLLQEASGTILVEGHADERGSEEYNLALGERRAETVRRYLSALGVPDSKLKVVSYGESRPAVRGHDESAWRWNRRAEFRTGN